PGPSDESGQATTITITKIPSFITVFKADGTTAVAHNTTPTLTEPHGLKYKTLATAIGAANITWTVKDDAGTANGGSDTLTETLPVSVTTGNDSPARTAGARTAPSGARHSS